LSGTIFFDRLRMRFGMAADALDFAKSARITWRGFQVFGDLWQIFEPGEIDEALRCAAAIGDDRLQMQAQGYVVPDSFTHGTSEQRVRWFSRGLKTGDMRQGDTFNAAEL
jgi:predicted metalloprotease